MVSAPPPELREAKERFLAIVEDIRPQLHRYCARMTGSLTDGEDIVQDTLAKAYYALSLAESVPNPRPWLFRIAHNRAVDWMRRYEHKHVVAADEIEFEPMATTDPDPIERAQANALAISCFFQLPLRPRAAVILKDILDHSVDDVAQVLQMSPAAVKAALSRGRRALRQLGQAAEDHQMTQQSPHLATARYIDLFNAQDWDSLRSMLAEDVRLDLISKADLRGQQEVGRYFGRYACQEDVQLKLGLFEGAPTIFVTQPGWPPYIMQLSWHGDTLSHIRDFRYVRYILDEFTG